jgi:hypothetical protein
MAAGCSLPLSDSGGVAAIASHSGAIVKFRGGYDPVNMLKLQIAGKIPSALQRPVLEHILKEIRGRGRPQVPFKQNAGVGMWVSGGYFGYIFGQNKSGNATVTAIDTVSNGCYYNYGIKVDHAQNLWTSCYNNASAEGGAVQEYAPGSAKPANTYRDEYACGRGCAFYGFANDVATDSSGHVFAANEFSELCSSRSCTYYAYPISWWSARSASSAATGIADPDIEKAYYLDTDSAGRLYVDGYGCKQRKEFSQPLLDPASIPATLGISDIYATSKCGYVVDEIDHPASAKRRTVTNLIGPGSTYFQGLYVSNGGTILNLVEPDSRLIARYALPFVPGESPSFLGPTVRNYAGDGSPIDGGFNAGDAMMVNGDAWGWLDVGKVQKNRWSGVLSINTNEDNVSAQYVPSDK